MTMPLDDIDMEQLISYLHQDKLGDSYFVKWVLGDHLCMAYMFALL